METKLLAFEIKSVDYEGRTLEGYAAAFGNIDQVGDIIHPGAFRKTLSERGQRIKVLWQHDPTEPIGRLVEAREDERGLYVKAVISDTGRGRDALALLKDGAIGEMSIGYDAVKGGTDYTKMDGKSVRNLREIKLYEFSLVTFPANEQAVVTALKQQDVMPSEGKPWVIAKRGDKYGVFKEGADGEATGEALGMHDSEAEALAQLRALYANEKKSITKSEADGDHPSSHYLVVEDSEKPTTWHLRVRDIGGKLDHRLMGAAWAALHGGYRGNEYAGPNKTEAISKLRRLYESEDMPVPGGDEKQVKAGRTISAATLAKLKAARDVIDELCQVGEYSGMMDEEEEPEEMKSAPGGVPQVADNEQAAQAGPVQPPTDAKRLLLEIEICEAQLHTLEVLP